MTLLFNILTSIFLAVTFILALAVVSHKSKKLTILLILCIILTSLCFALTWCSDTTIVVAQSYAKIIRV